MRTQATHEHPWKFSAKMNPSRGGQGLLLARNACRALFTRGVDVNKTVAVCSTAWSIACLYVDHKQTRFDSLFAEHVIIRRQIKNSTSCVPATLARYSHTCAIKVYAKG